MGLTKKDAKLIWDDDEMVSQLRAQLQLTHYPATGGAGVTPLSNTDLVVFEQLVKKVGLEHLPLHQPKQFECSGVRELVHALLGTQILLAPVTDHDLDVSDMNVPHDSIPARFISSDPLGLESEGPVDLQAGEITDNLRTSEPMDQSEELGHVAQLRGSTFSNLSVIPSGVSDYPSEDMDVTSHPSKLDSHSSLLTMNQCAGLSLGDLQDSLWGAEEDEATKHQSLYPTTQPYLSPRLVEVYSGWYEGEYCMDPAEVAPPLSQRGEAQSGWVHRGYKGHALPPARPDMSYFHFKRELVHTVAYPCTQ